MNQNLCGFKAKERRKGCPGDGASESFPKSSRWPVWCRGAGMSQAEKAETQNRKRMEYLGDGRRVLAAGADWSRVKVLRGSIRGLVPE